MADLGSDAQLPQGTVPTLELGRLMAKVLYKSGVSVHSHDLFETWASLWLETASLTNSPSTIRNYRGRLKVHIIPYFGGMKLSEITSEKIIQWIDNITFDNSNLVAINQAHGILKRILQSAVYSGILLNNPAASTSVPKPCTKRVHSLSYVQLIRLAEECGDYRLMILLAGTTGLKWGELVALRCKDVSILNRNLVINYTVSENSGGKKTLKEVLCHQKRVIRFPKQLQDSLDLIVHMKKEDDFLFESPTKGILDYHNFMQRVFRPAAKKHDLANISFRSLRQTAALLLAKDGTPTSVLSEILGHHSLQVTLSAYGYLYRNNSDSLLENSRNLSIKSNEIPYI